MRVEASLGGRRLTLDNVLDGLLPLSVERRRVESSIPCGFQVEWMDGEFKHDGQEGWRLQLTAGAGFGSRWMVLTIRDPEGKTFAQEVVDISELLQPWVDDILAHGRTPKVEP
jgi:hypothetical protein